MSEKESTKKYILEEELMKVKKKKEKLKYFDKHFKCLAKEKSSQRNEIF